MSLCDKIYTYKENSQFSPEKPYRVKNAIFLLLVYMKGHFHSPHIFTAETTFAKLKGRDLIF